jgi:alpha-glucosidase
MSRDRVRTPMPWDDTPNAGFTVPDTEPWLPLAGDSETRNVARQSLDARSPLSFFRRLAALRQGTPALVVGRYRSVPIEASDVYAYLRTSSDDRVLVVLNFGTGAHQLNARFLASSAEILLCTNPERSGQVALESLELQPNEGLLLRLGAEV